MPPSTFKRYTAAFGYIDSTRVLDIVIAADICSDSPQRNRLEKRWDKIR